MEVLFCHDGPIYYDGHNYYSLTFNDKLMKRYESIFGNIGIITRVEDKTPGINYKESDILTTDKHRVVKYPNYLTMKGILSNKTDSNKILELEISKCDALIIRLPSFLGNRCIDIAQKYNKPYLIEMVGCPWDSLRNHSLKGKILAPYMYLRTRFYVNQAEFVLYVTNEFLQQRYPTKGLKVGCSDVELQDNREHKRIKRMIIESKKKITLGTIGKIDLKYKGQATVIKALKILKKAGYDVEYSVVGPGEKRYLQQIALENGVLSNVSFEGAMTHDKIFDWLDNIDIYIQPSLTEGLPRSLIEAMSCGCICIASNVGGMPELLEKRFLFKKGHEKELADIILNAEKNGLFEQGKRNYEYAKQFYSVNLEYKRQLFYKTFKNSMESYI